MEFEKTVLQVIPELDAGGAERSTVEIASAIIAAGGRALVATRGGRLTDELCVAGAKVFPMPVHSKNPFTIIANRGRLLELIRKEAVDIVHVRSRAPAWSALWASRAAGVPLVATYHGAYNAGNPLKKLYNSAMVRGHLIIANSEFTARSIRAQYAVDPARLLVIPRGADLASFDPAAVSAHRVEALARAWGVNHDSAAFKLLLPGRLTGWKGQLPGIQAVGRLRELAAASGQHIDLKLILAGDAQGRDAYLAAVLGEIEKRGVRDMVQVVGHCADMPAAYAWADAVLSPALRPEAFGRVAVEAGAMEKPVVGSNIGGARETIVDGETGWLTPPGDVDAIAASLARLMALSPDARRMIGERARMRVMRIYSTEAMCRSTLSAYARLNKG